jgi:hypothetical protein
MALPLAALAAIPGVIDLTRSIFAGKEVKADQAKLEAEARAMKVPESIMDVYNKNLARYSPNAYQSAEYNAQMRNVLANQAAGVSALQSRRSALAGLPSITQGTNVASQRAAASAEQAQRANLSQLGGAAGSLAQQQNLIRQAKLNLMAQKAAAGAQRQNLLGQSALKSFTNAATLGMYAGLGKSATSPTKPDFSKYLTTPTLAGGYATQDYYQAPITPRYSDVG